MHSERYIPPYRVSEEAVNLIAEISAAVERFDIEISGVSGVRLRKTNRIKTIRGSTAIEGNTLTEEQITAVPEGKKVVAPQKEIDEVLCAAAAYEAIEDIGLGKMKDLLKVHKLESGEMHSTPPLSRTSSGRIKAAITSPFVVRRFLEIQSRSSISCSRAFFRHSRSSAESAGPSV